MYCRTLPTTQTWPHVIFSFFQKLKKHLSGRRYRFRSALGSAVHQFLMGVLKDECKNWIKRLKQGDIPKEEYFEGN